MSKMRAVVAGVVIAAVTVVMPGGWVAFAADEIPDAPGGALNEAFAPPAAADDGVSEVGEVPTDPWLLDPEPVTDDLALPPRMRPAPESTATTAPEPEEAKATEAPTAPAPTTSAEASTDEGVTPEGSKSTADDDAVPSPAPTESPVATEAPAEEAEEEPETAEPETAPPAEIGGGELEPPVTNAAPVGTPIGAPGLGALPWFSFDEIPLTVQTVARVNLGNGNLLLTGSDQIVNGAAIPLRNDRFYNGLSSSGGAFGGGWSSSLSALDVGLQVSGTTATYRGPNGYEGVFTASGTTWTSPAGFKATLTTRSYGWRLIFNDSGEEIRFNSSGWITNYFDRNSVGLTFGYTSGKLTTVTETSGRSFTIAYQTSDPTKIRSVTDSAGRQTLYTLTSGRLTRVDSPGGMWEEYGYDSSGRLNTVTWDFEGTGDGKITFTYDAQSRVASVAQGGSTGSPVTTQSYVYNSGNTVVTDGNSHVTTYTIDAGGKVTSVLDALGHTRSQAYNANNSVTSTTDGLASGSTPGNSTLYTYDALGNASSATLPTGAASSARYALGNGCTNTGGSTNQVKCSTDASGNKKRYDYDSAGNTTSVTDTTTGGTGVVEQRYTYAVAGTGCQAVTGNTGGFAGQVCSSQDGNNNTTTYRYDLSGNITLITPPAPMGTTSYTYDSLGRVLTVTDGNSDTTTYTYNVRDEILTTKFDNNEMHYTVWKANGLKDRESSVTDSTGPLAINTYNTVGWLTNQVTRTTAATTSTVQYNYTYDGEGNTLTYNDTIYGTTTYTYDDANQLIRLQEPAVSCGTTGTGCINFEYDANGAETKRTLRGGATVETTYDAAGRSTRITAKDAAGVTRVDIGYSFIAPGGSGASADRTAIQTRTSYMEQGITAGAVTTYGYDSLNRLTAATEKVGATTSASWAYTYDAAGNRTGQTRAGSTGATAGATTYGYNAANQLTSATGSTTSWTYDAAGNQTKNGFAGQTSAVNDRGGVTDIGSTDYTLWGGGNSQLSRSSGGATMTVLNSPSGYIGDTTSPGSGASSAITLTPDGEAVSYRTSGSARYYYAKDHLGSVVGLFRTDGSFVGGYSYSPYGETRAQGTSTVLDTNTQRYIAGYYDVSVGLYKLGARYYDPTIGRFTQFDPSGQEKNPYAYAAGDPVNNADPSGLGTVQVVIAIVQFVFLGYTVNQVVGGEATLASITVGFAVDLLCVGTIASIGIATGGVGAIGVAIACGILSELAGGLAEELLIYNFG